MFDVVFNLAAALVILWVMGFSFYCAFLRMMAKIDKNANERVGKIIWTWGEVVIIGTILIAVITMSLILANLVLSQIGMIGSL